MGRRRLTPEFKLEAVKLVRERDVTVRQAAADLGLHENVLRTMRFQWGERVNKDDSKGDATQVQISTKYSF